MGLAVAAQRPVGTEGVGRCCICSVRGAVKLRHGLASDRQGKLVECDRQAPGDRLLDREFVVASSQMALLHLAITAVAVLHQSLNAAFDIRA
jgi:hypothetical protein